MKASEIDWSKAPEWATGYGFIKTTDVDVWVSDDCYTYVNGQQQGTVFSTGHGEGWSLDEIRVVSSRPSAWDGTGLPPVGTVCEALWNEASDHWLKSKVFGANEHGQPIHRWEEGPKIYEYQASPLHGPHGTAYFRPIRTPEQIAAEERERAVDAMMQTFVVTGSEKNLLRNACLALYDTGYRKVEGDKQ